MSIASLQDRLPGYARDVKLNLSAMAEDDSLTPQQKYGLLVACGHATRNADVAAALEGEAASHLSAEALDAVQDFIDDALMVDVGSVSILHGKGTGALKEEIRRYLRTVPEVESARDEHADRGGAGITIVTFDLS